MAQLGTTVDIETKIKSIEDRLEQQAKEATEVAEIKRRALAYIRSNPDFAVAVMEVINSRRAY